MTATARNQIDKSRRGFLSGKGVAYATPIRPPWTDEYRIAESCTRCEACVQACPEGVLKQGQGGFPAFDPALGSGVCTFCGVCAGACDDGVFDLTRTPPWTLKITIETSSCLAHAGIHCSSCKDACDDGAVDMLLRIGGPPKPEILTEKCTGCGACVGTCPGGAIKLNNEESLGDVA